MSFENKFIKYKNKYFEVMNNIQGGFMMSYETKDYHFKKMIYLHIITYLKKYEDIFLNPFPNPNIYVDIYEMNSLEYLEIYKKLIISYKNNTKYTQTFIDSDDNLISKNENVFPTHINFGALIFISFLLELELFMITNSNVGYNYFDKGKEYLHNKNCSATFCDSLNVCSFYRVYKNILLNNPEKLLDIFTQKLDNLFTNYMNTFITGIYSKYNPGIDVEDSEIKKIYELIVPTKYKHHQKNTFDYIHINWKNLLVNYINDNFKEDTTDNINGEINIILERTMNKYQSKDMQYIAEGTGFFSFIFLNFPGYDQIKNFGSCITYSMLEIYIMSRLHINPKNINLVIEKQLPDDRPHGIWKYTQSGLGNINLSHWSTSFDFSNNKLVFRSTIGPEFKLVKKINISEKNLIFKALIYPNLDSYNYFLKSCNYPNKKHLKEFINLRKVFFDNELIEKDLGISTTSKISKNLKSIQKKYFKGIDILLNIKPYLLYNVMEVLFYPEFSKTLNINMKLKIFKEYSQNYLVNYKGEIYKKEDFNNLLKQLEDEDVDVKLLSNLKNKEKVINISSEEYNSFKDKLPEDLRYVIKLIYPVKNVVLTAKSKSQEQTDLIKLSKFFKKMVYKVNIESTRLDKEQLEKHLTNFIVTKFLTDGNQRSRFLELIINIFETSLDYWINQYIKYKIPKNKEHLKKDIKKIFKDKIKFVYKGGLSLRLIYKQTIKQFSISVENLIEEYFGEYFNLSDYDFEISINLFKKNREEYLKIFNQLSILSYNILNKINEYLNSNNYKSKIFNYFNYNDSEKTNLLKDLFSKIKYEINSNQKYNNVYTYNEINTLENMYLLINENISYTDNELIKSNEFLLQNSKYFKSFNNSFFKKNLYKNNREGFLILDKIDHAGYYNKLNINKLKFIIAQKNFKYSIINGNQITILDILNVIGLEKYKIPINKLMNDYDGTPSLDINFKFNIKTEINFIKEIFTKHRDNMLKLIESNVIKGDKMHIDLHKRDLELFDINLNIILELIENYETNTEILNIDSKSFYTTFNNNIFVSGHNFSLSRIKYNFRLFFTDKLIGKNKKYLDLGGEVIDVSIRNNDWKKDILEYQKYKFKDKNTEFNYNSYSLSSHFLDIMCMLYKESNINEIVDSKNKFSFPWNNSKYIKRLGRLLFILFLNEFNKSNLIELIEIITRLIEIFNITIFNNYNKHEHLQQIKILYSFLLTKNNIIIKSGINEFEEYKQLNNFKLILFLKFHINFLEWCNLNTELKDIIELYKWSDYMEYCKDIVKHLDNLRKILNQIQLDIKKKIKISHKDMINVSKIGFDE